MKKSKLVYFAVLQSFGVFVYVSAVSCFLFNGQKLLGGKPDSLWQPLAMLLLFVASAAITGLLIFGRPIYFYLDGFKKEAVKLLIYTILFLFLITLIVLLINIVW